MDNQHRHIKGYRELSEQEILIMNNIKSHGEQLEKLITNMRGDETLDQRWVSIGQTDLQKGIMALVRAVAQPSTF